MQPGGTVIWSLAWPCLLRKRNSLWTSPLWVRTWKSHEMVKSEQGVQIAQLQASASVKKSEGEAASTRLRASGDADAIRTTGQAKAEAHSAGINAVGQDTYALMQRFQIIAEKNLRVVPDVLVNGGGGSSNSFHDVINCDIGRSTY